MTTNLSTIRQRISGRSVVMALLGASYAICAAAQNPVTKWNEYAVAAALSGNQTISPGSNTSGGAGIYLAYVHLAIFNAVNAIDGRFEPYGPGLAPAPGASTDAAAISAAYFTLLNYFPNQAATLTQQYAGSLASIPNSGSKDLGLQLGLAAANQIISLRAGDGRGANVTYTYPSVPVAGVWIPTPPGFAAPQTPWVGKMKPLTMSRPDQFLPDEPPPMMGSAEWADDYDQVKSLGALNSPIRTATQTEIGLFWTEQTAGQYARAFRKLAEAKALNTSDSARLFATLWTAYADSFIGCMNAKYYFSFWRPVTAIRNGDLDGNPETLADAGWTPLFTTPNHPEYPAAHGCVTGAVANTLKGFFGTPNVDLKVSSTVTGQEHPFTSVHDLEREVEWARIFVGFHYHHSLVQGFVLGHKVADQVVHGYFRPVRGNR